ncbi:MAG: hypothetical protein U5Q03_16630 [Bacteroidota bacterium]|nr:hypothetical protein [Bacteroidota bacterium]
MNNDNYIRYHHFTLTGIACVSGFKNGCFRQIARQAGKTEIEVIAELQAWEIFEFRFYPHENESFQADQGLFTK